MGGGGITDKLTPPPILNMSVDISPILHLPPPPGLMSLKLLTDTEVSTRWHFFVLHKTTHAVFLTRT